MERRRFLRRAGAGGVALLAGCSAEPVEDGDGGADTTTTTTAEEDTTTATTDEGATTTATTESAPTLTVATYPAFVDAPSTSPGPWLKEAFESRFDATLEWAAPEGGLTHYIQRKAQGAPIEADVYAGLTPMDLVRVEKKLSADLFQPTDPSELSNADHIHDRYFFDAKERAVPFDASFVSFVYDETAVDAPDTYQALTKPAYESALLLPNPQSAVTGKMFLLMTVHQFGSDGYLDYWKQLSDNGLHVLGSWSDAYAAYSEGEAPVVVSYSTDQVYAARNDQDMSRHQVAFPDGQGYAYVDGAARFADTDRPDLGRRFIEFLLRPKVQAEIAQRNVALPAVDNATLPADYEELVYRPEEPVTFSDERLAANLDTWVDEWSRQIAGN